MTRFAQFAALIAVYVCIGISLFWTWQYATLHDCVTEASFTVEMGPSEYFPRVTACL